MKKETLRGKSFGWHLTRSFDLDGEKHFYYLGRDVNGYYLGFTPVADFCRKYLSMGAMLKLINDESYSRDEALRMYNASANCQKYF